MMIDLKNFEIWFVTGSQHLYGSETLKQVAEHSQEIAISLNKSKSIPVNVVYKPVLTTPVEILNLFVEANTTPKCIGIITWCHTFSPSKMWINGLKLLSKPLLHLHTQFNRDIPWSEIDMDFMNLNQSAHGDREHGFIMSRMRINRKVVVGYWKELDVQERIGIWTRAAAAWNDMKSMKIARFGDNMREVAVTEGDKVEAQIQFGLSVNGYGIGDLVKVVNQVSNKEIDKLVNEYFTLYSVSKDGKPGCKFYENIRYQSRLEIGMRRFLEEGGFNGFTTTFEDLHGLEQLPGLAVQRLMNDGYGFGAEGDWKHAAMVRVLKVMGSGLKGGASFMEDYTYHLDPKGMKILGAHMLEICPSISDGNIKLEVHPLGIGNKNDPARLVFNVPSGKAICVSFIDMGNRFRMISSDVQCMISDTDLPKLPVARALWIPQPDLKIGATAWILAGGAHHTSFSQAVTSECIEDLCEMAGIEYLKINSDTRIDDFKNTIRWNEMYYMLNKSLR